jgi:hypothetical protein
VTGTVCRLSARLVAVTVTSSSCRAPDAVAFSAYAQLAAKLVLIAAIAIAALDAIALWRGPLGIARSLEFCNLVRPKFQIRSRVVKYVRHYRFGLATEVHKINCLESPHGH